MTLQKNWFRNRGWSFGSILITILFILFIFAMVFNVIVTVKYGTPREQNAFTNDDINYMINIIENEYGNGQKFVMLKGISNAIQEDNGPDIVSDVPGKRDREYIGERYGIFGHFENQDNGYYVVFVRYIKNSPYKAGNNVIIETYMKDDLDLKDYVK